MKTTTKKLPKSQISFTVELTEEEWNKYRVQALRRLAGTVRLDGFRKGHIPENVLLEKIGEDSITAETIDIALPQCYLEAVRSEKVQPIAQPEVKILKESPFTFEAVVSVYPEVTVKPITKMKVKTKKVTVEKKEIDDMVIYIQKQIAEKKEVDRGAKEGDMVIVDFTGKDKDGVVLDGTQGKNHPVEIGSKTMIPGFEDNLKNLKKGDEKTFELAFPKTYHVERFAGKKVVFTVKVVNVEEKILPAVDEAFVEKITGKKNPVETFRKEIEENLKIRKENEMRQEWEQTLLEEVEKSTKADIPEVLIEDEVNYLIDSLKMQGLQRGITWENQLVHMKKSEEEIKKGMRAQAEKQVRIRIGIQKSLEMEHIAVEEKEIEGEVTRVTSRMREDDRKEKAGLFVKGEKGWREAEHRLRVGKWIDGKLAELVRE